MQLKYVDVTCSESLLRPCGPVCTKDSQNVLPTWAGEQWWCSKPWNHDNSSYKTMRSSTPVELLKAGAQRLFTKISLQEPYFTKSRYEQMAKGACHQLITESFVAFAASSCFGNYSWQLKQASKSPRMSRRVEDWCWKQPQDTLLLLVTACFGGCPSAAVDSNCAFICLIIDCCVVKPWSVGTNVSGVAFLMCL